MDPLEQLVEFIGDLLRMVAVVHQENVDLRHDNEELRIRQDRIETLHLCESLTFAEIPPVPAPDYPTDPLGNTAAPTSILESWSAQKHWPESPGS